MNMEDKKDWYTSCAVYEQIRQIRKSLKLNQAEFADLLGIAQSRVSLIENNKANVSVGLLQLIANKTKHNIVIEAS